MYLVKAELVYSLQRAALPPACGSERGCRALELFCCSLSFYFILFIVCMCKFLFVYIENRAPLHIQSSIWAENQAHDVFNIEVGFSTLLAPECVSEDVA